MLSAAAEEYWTTAALLCDATPVARRVGGSGPLIEVAPTPTVVLLAGAGDPVARARIQELAIACEAESPRTLSSLPLAAAGTLRRTARWG